MTQTFKKGDTIKCIQTVGGDSRYGAVGQTFEVKALRDGGLTLQVRIPGWGLSWLTASRFELVTPAMAPKADFTGPYRCAKVVKTWIIAVLNKDGKPQPTTTPKTYVSEAQAFTVAKEMAHKHPGETFMVLQGVAVAAQPKVVEVEVVRL